MSHRMLQMKKELHAIGLGRGDGGGPRRDRLKVREEGGKRKPYHVPQTVRGDHVLKLVPLSSSTKNAWFFIHAANVEMLAKRPAESSN